MELAAVTARSSRRPPRSSTAKERSDPTSATRETRHRRQWLSRCCSPPPPAEGSRSVARCPSQVRTPRRRAGRGVLRRSRSSDTSAFRSRQRRPPPIPSTRQRPHCAVTGGSARAAPTRGQGRVALRRLPAPVRRGSCQWWSFSSRRYGRAEKRLWTSRAVRLLGYRTQRAARLRQGNTRLEAFPWFFDVTSERPVPRSV